MKEDVVDTWESGAGFSKYTVSKTILFIYIFVIFLSFMQDTSHLNSYFSDLFEKT